MWFVAQQEAYQALELDWAVTLRGFGILHADVYLALWDTLGFHTLHVLLFLLLQECFRANHI